MGHEDCIIVHRIYDKPIPEGFKILVDGLWPRGISKSEIDYWAREIAPSAELRRWYSHDPSRWEEFRKRYHEELKLNNNLVEFLNLLKSKCENHQKIIFLYSSIERVYNNANALKDFINEST